MIRAYDLQPDGTVRNMQVFHNFYPGRSADGMTIDSAGNVYAAAGLHRRARHQRDAGYAVRNSRVFARGQTAALHPDSGGHGNELRLRRAGYENSLRDGGQDAVPDPHGDSGDAEIGEGGASGAGPPGGPRLPD